MGALDEIGTTIRTLLDGPGRGVVGVVGGPVVGSGVVIADGRVLTNAHNLRSDDIAVVIAGERLRAESLGVDVDGDVAVLAVATGDAEPIRWGSAPQIGTPVFAVSNPAGSGRRVTFGLVSATERTFRGPRGRSIAGGIEHTAPLVSGSSGGPVLDADGRLLGINTHRLGDGFYLALPADEALRARVDELGRGQLPARPRLGIAVAPARVARRLRSAVGLPEVDGVLVRRVESGSAAADADVRQGDLIVAVDGTPTPDVDALYAAVEKAGSTARVDLIRGADPVAVDVAVRT